MSKLVGKVASFPFVAHLVQEISLFHVFQYGVGGHLGFEGLDRLKA